MSPVTGSSRRPATRSTSSSSETYARVTRLNSTVFHSMHCARTPRTVNTQNRRRRRRVLREVPHIDKDEDIRADSCRFDRLSLLAASRIPVEQPAAALRIRLLQAVDDHLYDHVIWHQITLVHVLLCLLSCRTAGLHLCPQQVSSRDVHQPMLQRQQRGSLATQQNLDKRKNSRTACVPKPGTCT